MKNSRRVIRVSTISTTTHSKSAPRRCFSLSHRKRRSPLHSPLNHSNSSNSSNKTCNKCSKHNNSSSLCNNSTLCSNSISIPRSTCISNLCQVADRNVLMGIDAGIITRVDALTLTAKFLEEDIVLSVNRISHQGPLKTVQRPMDALANGVKKDRA
jgi:hypothetical protein